MKEVLYGTDLADIQAQAHGRHVAQAWPGLIDLLRRGGITEGRVVDLGCGDGAWLAHLDAAGYEAVGVEPSPALRGHARRRAPGARVLPGTAQSADLSGARAVTALGEVFNYLLPVGRVQPLSVTFRRIAAALPADGLLLFDLIVAGRPSLETRTWVEGDDWLLTIDMKEASGRGERRISVFRRSGTSKSRSSWRRSNEVHRIRIPSVAEALDALRRAGFAARTRRRWHEAPLLPRRLAFIARLRAA